MKNKSTVEQKPINQNQITDDKTTRSQNKNVGTCRGKETKAKKIKTRKTKETDQKLVLQYRFGVVFEAFKKRLLGVFFQFLILIPTRSHNIPKDVNYAQVLAGHAKHGRYRSPS